MDYKDAKILAPMVRAGTLPLRLLCLDYGADLVYGEEIIDHRLLQSERVVNEKYGTVQFMKAGMVTYSTCVAEEGRNVFQMGTSDAARALSAASMLVDDVAAIDINMGCPKRFSIQGGMGAALLTNPVVAKMESECSEEAVAKNVRCGKHERMVGEVQRTVMFHRWSDCYLYHLDTKLEQPVDVRQDIVQTLSRNLPIPVTAKIRLLDGGIQDTITFIKMLESAGAKAVTVHARTKEMRPQEPARWDDIKIIASDKSIGVPIIHNGDIITYDDWAECKKTTGAAGFMTARGGMVNPSMFSPNYPVESFQIAHEYLQKCIETGAIYQTVKYMMQSMLGKYINTPKGFGIQRAKSMRAVCASLNNEKAWVDFQKELEKENMVYAPIRPWGVPATPPVVTVKAPCTAESWFEV